MRKKSPTMAWVFSFDIKFTGGKRTAFYRKLFGFSTRARYVDKDGSVKTYTHVSPGLLSEIPHVKLGKSVIAVPAAGAARLKSFFSSPRWQPMELHIFGAFLPPDIRLRAMEEALNRRITIAPKQRVGLREEIDELSSSLKNIPPEPTTVERARRALGAADELMKLDWSEEREFSRALESRLAPLRESLGHV